MSWKENKVRLFLPAEGILSEKKPDIQDLLLLGQSVSSLKCGPAQGQTQPALPMHPVKSELLEEMSAQSVQTMLEPPVATLLKRTPPPPLPTAQADASAMPPPPPPSKRTSISPTASGVSSTSEEAVLSGADRSDIEFDTNDQVLCRVCGDKASGFHYGVHSCEGCKGFFRRSIQQKIQYRPCTKNQQCNILRINRNRCQYCRLKKCISAGMSRDAVRFGRVPKREKAKIMAAMQSSRMKTQESRVMAEMSDDGRIVETIVRAHYDTCDYTRNKMEPFVQRAKAAQAFAACTGKTCPMKGRPEDSFLEQFSDKFMDHVRQVCTFAKLIPGFKCLHHDDQVTLLKSCVFEVLLVRLAGLFENQGLICLNGDIISKDTINQMPIGNAKFLMDSVFELAQRINHFKLSDAEIGLFCAVVIITPDRPGLRSPDLVQRMQNKLKMVLSSILLPQHPEHASIFSELMTMVHDLRTLNTLHTEKFLQQCKVSSSQMSPTSAHSAVSALQQHLAILGRAGCQWDDDHVEQQLTAHVVATAHADRDSAGNASPHSQTSSEDMSCRRSPFGSVSSSESVCSNEVSRLTAHDLRVVNSALLMPIKDSAATVTLTRRKCPSEEALLPIVPEMINPSVLLAASSSSAGLGLNNAATVSRFKLRKVDSPGDSGIDSPKASQGGSHSTNTSVCSSPRSSMDEEGHHHRASGEAESAHAHAAPHVEEQHPLLKRALQQPPQQYPNNTPVATFQDEVYKPHKKFRRHVAQSDDCPSSSTQLPCDRATSPVCPPPAPPAAHGASSLLISQLSAPPQSYVTLPGKHSLLASTLSRATPQEISKRNDILANLILNPSSAYQHGGAASSLLQAGLLMCAPQQQPTTASTSMVVPSRHIPVQAAPTKHASAAIKTVGCDLTLGKPSRMAQLAAAAVAAAAAEVPQPLNLSTRTPPPQSETATTSPSSSRHDIPTEA